MGYLTKDDWVLHQLDQKCCSVTPSTLSPENCRYQV